MRSTGRIVSWLGVVLVVMPAVMLIIWTAMCLIVSLNEANAKEPATIEILGDSSARRTECDAHRTFTENVLKLRDKGKTLNEVIGMILARAVAMGMPTESLGYLKSAITNVWDILGDTKAIGQAVFFECMKDEGV